jgi:hypothetical protein
MMAMTYRALLNSLQVLTPEQLDSNVTVFIREQGEFYPIVDDYPFVIAGTSSHEDVPGSQESALDDGHPYLVI